MNGNPPEFPAGHDGDAATNDGGPPARDGARSQYDGARPQHDGGTTTAPEVPWQRVHPVSPLVRGWLAVLAIAYFFGQNWLDDLFRVGGESENQAGEWQFTPNLLVVIGIGVALLLLIVLGFFLSWYFTKYQITARHVNVNSGVVFRQQRQARIDRVQAIDIAQPLVARIFGLAELKFEVADAGATAMNLAYIKIGDAKKLRNAILARAAGLRNHTGTQQDEVRGMPASSGAMPASDHEAPAAAALDGTDGSTGHGSAARAAYAPGESEDAEAPERIVATVPPGRLIASTLASPWTVIMLLVIVAGFVASALSDGAFSVVYLLPMFIGFVPVLWAQFNQGYNFRAAMSPDGLRLSYGLLDTRHQTVPPGRVQAVMVLQGVIWRKFGWHKVVINVAGYGGGGSPDVAVRSTVLPVGTREDVLNVLSIVLPDPGTEHPVQLIEAGIAGFGADEGFTTSPRAARWFSPFAWRRQGFATTGTALFARGGVLIRSLVIVPHERTQGLILDQGPLNRRAGLCNVQLCTTDGPISPRVKQAGVAAGRELFLQQADRAGSARRRNDRDHWLEGPRDA